MSRKQREIERFEVAESMVYSWDKMPGEGQVPYRLFELYLTLGKSRNYINATNLCEKSYSYICSLGNQFSWKIRSDDYDAYKDHQMMVQLDEEILKSRVRQQRIGEDLQKLGEKGVEMLNDYPEELTAADIAKLIDVGVKIERLALGSSTEITESKIDATVAVKVEEIDPTLAAEIGKLIAIKKSEMVDK